MKLRLFARSILAVLCVAAPAGAQDFASALADGKNAAMIAQHMRHPQYLIELRKARAAGLPTSIEEILPKPPPESQNAVALYLKLGDRKAFPTEQQETDAYAVTKSGPRTKAEWATAAAFIRSHTALLAAVHAAASRPLCVVPRHFKSGSNPADIKFPEFGPMRRAARIIAIESLVLAKAGKPIDAVRNQALSFKVADHAASGLLIIALLVSDSVDDLAFRGMQDILALSGGNAVVAAAVDHGIADRWHSHSLTHALRSEFAWHVALTKYMWMSGPQAMVDAATSPGQTSPKVTLPPATFNALMDANGTYLVKLDRELLNASGLPYTQVSAKFREISDQESVPGDLSTFVSSTLLSAFPPTHHFATSAAAGVTRAAAAVFVYKSKHGTYPSTLAEATSTAIDPFDSKPLRYRREGKGFVVYSIGPTAAYPGDPQGGKPPRDAFFKYP